MGWTMLCHWALHTTCIYTIDYRYIYSQSSCYGNLKAAQVGMKPESAYYESLHETPLIANTIARKQLS